VDCLNHPDEIHQITPIGIGGTEILHFSGVEVHMAQFGGF
jgi:hypothetical protein